MPDPNLDRLKAVSKAARRVYDAPKPLGIYQDIYTMFDDLLRLAEENRKMKQGMDKIVDCFVGCDKCKEKVKRQIAIVEELLVVATRKDDDEKH